MSQLRRDALTRFEAAQKLLPPPVLIFDERPGCCVLKPPAALDFDENYEETMAFLMAIRGRASVRGIKHPETGVRLRLFTDFAILKTIAPGAGLVLAAELDRRRLGTGLKPRSLDDEWDPEVRAYFHQAGLFDLLGIKPQHEGKAGDHATLHAVRFVRGRSVKGQIGSAVRDQLEALCGKKIGPRLTVYEAISEAIANTRHAYPRDVAIWPSKATGSWWSAGTWNSATNTVSLQIYDQGVGIPATLPRSEHWSNIIKLVGLADRLHPERRDDQLLAAALEVGRTSTGEKGRGKGLAEMAAWVDKLGNGFLRITSGKGSMTYRPGVSVSGTSRRAPFFGTLVEWEICLGG
ncbi:hypothetical protein [Sphingomonas sp. 22176]|uniref:hypothetical protein n=1 Tax=Sphingomonas sp. 22176 TaxID=3453884 RepID=UPI003F84CD6B